MPTIGRSISPAPNACSAKPLRSARLEEGYEFAFDTSELEELGKFVSLERKCCPFLSFELEVPAGKGRIRFRIHGPPGSRDLIEAEILP